MATGGIESIRSIPTRQWATSVTPAARQPIIPGAMDMAEMIGPVTMKAPQSQAMSGQDASVAVRIVEIPAAAEVAVDPR
jgi:hypothetical protein